ncbi:MAG: SPOR domain-containing protein, partial [Bacteroidota bacterium]
RRGYVIQLSSWTTRAKANLLAAHAKRSFPGYESFVETVNLPNLGIRHRVQIGTFRTKDAAQSNCETHRQTHN